MLFSVLIFLLVLSVLVLVHELGHFLVARRAGIWVEEFGFGLPPRVVAKKVGETVFSLNLFPFGGFVRLHGEDVGERIAVPERAFLNKSKKARFSVLVAGVVMNFFLAVVAFAVVYSFSGIPRETNQVKVVEVAPGSPAQIGGLLVGDLVQSVDKKAVTTVDEFVKAVEAKKGSRVIIETQDRKITLKPRESPPEGEGPLGVVITTSEVYFPPVALRPFYGIYYGFKEALLWGRNVVLGFGKIFTDLFKGKVPEDIAGPVGIFAITSKAATFGLLALINLVGVLSVNLAFFNILPFPALDGGRLIFLGIERVIGRKVWPKLERISHVIGMIVLLALLLALTIQDIKKLILAGGISGFGEKILK